MNRRTIRHYGRDLFGYGSRDVVGWALRHCWQRHVVIDHTGKRSVADQGIARCSRHPRIDEAYEIVDATCEAGEKVGLHAEAAFPI
ncbi:hypothetical protein [Bosea sp. (in: a-proteobacteria)]|uniref:hypothetical protein n=1 Tax=Bosea sp. (in: a-proteobacteria) TaxID=1871050 RepID=UPI00261F461D|nr:hypothetical protein [Bosea sp. (in: a-proteobacteria)]MCO5090031.1 hypothetical protein [Bosea sp. (in: a-proteobacteria)]